MMPAGKYLVGDLCYVMHTEWDEVCELLFAGRTDHGCNEGEFTLKDGRRFAIYNTAHGDGVYDDNVGNAYPVDAGCIGCIRVEDVNDPEMYLAGMNIINFASDFTTDTDGDTIEIGHVRVYTGYEEEDEDDFPLSLEYDDE